MGSNAAEKWTRLRNEPKWKDFCECGKIKPADASKVIKCKNCGVFPCPVFGCVKTYKIKTSALTHFRNIHGDTQNKIVDCTCKRPDSVVSGMTRSQCMHKTRHFCLYGFCNKQFSSDLALIDHQIHCPENPYIGKDFCSGCLTAKIRDNTSIFKKCSNCQRYWCLVDQCPFESKNVEELKLHQYQQHGV